MEIKDWLELKNWVVIGASEKKEGYGSKVFKRLKDAQYHVTPVSPNYDQVFGIKAYKNLQDVEGEIDVVTFVVRPEIGMKVLDACVEKGVKRITLQPGSANKELLAKAKSLDLEVLEACVLTLIPRT